MEKYEEKSGVVYSYQDLLKEPNKMPDIKRNSILIMDDLSSYNYNKLQKFIDCCIDVYAHHKSLVVIIIIQNFIKNNLSNLLLKCNSIQISTINQSCYKSLRYISMYNFSKEQRQLIINSMHLCKNYSEDKFLIINLKSNHIAPSKYFISINSFGHLTGNKKPCIVLSDDIGENYIFKEKGAINIFDYNKKSVIKLQAIQQISSQFTTVSEFNERMAQIDDQYVMIPKELYNDIVLKIEESSSLKCQGEETDSKKTIFKENYSKLQDNLMTYISSNMPPKKITQSKKVAHELLINPYLSFIGTSGRTMIINSLQCLNKCEILQFKDVKPLQTKINVLEYIREVTKYEIKFGKIRSKKPVQIYILCTKMLLYNDAPSFIFLNKKYT